MTMKKPKGDPEYIDAEVFLAWDENGVYVASVSAEEAIEVLDSETTGQLRSVARFEVKLPLPRIQDGGELIVPARGHHLKLVSD